MDLDCNAYLVGRGYMPLRSAIRRIKRRSPGEFPCFPIFCEGDPDSFTLAEIDAMDDPAKE